MSKKDRKEACRLAAEVMCSLEDREVMPTLWSLAVFFEHYMSKGAKGTVKSFGPKKPTKIKVVR